MSSLTNADKRYLETILDMGSGYVLHFSDVTFGEFFSGYNIDIHSHKYQIYGTSKANKMRAFWRTEPDDLVGRVLLDLLEIYKANCELSCQQGDTSLLVQCHAIINGLLRESPRMNSLTIPGFLNKELDVPSLNKLPVALPVVEIIQSRLEEAQSCLAVGAHLAVIFHCGSVLEAVLLGAAENQPQTFNRSKSSPKRHGKVKSFQEWSLSEFIDVAHEIGFLKPDVQKFSHGLRDFRNYIHPYQQLVSDFAPDEHTAKVCIQVLKAALADLAGER